MQGRFDLGGGELERWRGLLRPLVADIVLRPRRAPIGEYVKALISSRTRDAVSLGAYTRLVAKYGGAARIATAPPAEVERVIHDVTFADVKARQLVTGLGRMRREGTDLRLAFLAGWPLATALGWLERFPGVGRKVAAAVLNASLLDRPVFIVDTHVLRVLRRLRFVGANADYRVASEAVTAAMPAWSGTDFLGFHAALKRLGQQICTWDVPLCGQCPLHPDCPTAVRADAVGTPGR